MEDSQIRQILADILESPEFKDSQRYRELLRFLVEESLAGRTPKESTIGTQFFGKESTFNSKEDATVRVYINNLRKKLDHYYLTSDKTFTHKLSIPTGHYKVEFIPISEKAESGTGRSRGLRYAVIAVGIVGSFALGYLASRVTQTGAQSTQPPNAIWNDFVRNDARPILVVLGDYFFLRERAAVSAYYRRVTINTPEDYQRLISEDPGFARRYEPNNFTFLRPSGLLGLTQILPIIQKSPNGHSVKLASQVTMSDFKSNNVIFIGPFKTLFSFQKFLHIFGMEYPGDTSRVHIRSQADGSLHEFSIGEQRGGTYEKDFAFIAKGTGPEGSIILMLLGFAETGVIESARAASDSLLFKAVAMKFPSLPVTDPGYFTLVIRTEGISQAIFNADIRYFVQIRPVLKLSDPDREDSSWNH